LRRRCCKLSAVTSAVTPGWPSRSPPTHVPKLTRGSGLRVAAEGGVERTVENKRQVEVAFAKFADGGPEAPKPFIRNAVGSEFDCVVNIWTVLKGLQRLAPC